MVAKLNINRFFPHPLAANLYTFLPMTNAVVHHAINFRRIRFGTVSVQDNTSIFQPGFSERFSIDLFDCSWPWGPLASLGRSRPEQNQFFWCTALNNASPLFPYGVFVLLSGCIVRCFSEYCFVRFEGDPILATAKLDVFLLSFNILFTLEVERLPQPFHNLVVDVRHKASNCRLTSARKNAHQHGGLVFQRQMGILPTCAKEGVVMVGEHIFLATFFVAPIRVPAASYDIDERT